MAREGRWQHKDVYPSIGFAGFDQFNLKDNEQYVEGQQFMLSG